MSLKKKKFKSLNLQKFGNTINVTLLEQKRFSSN